MSWPPRPPPSQPPLSEVEVVNHAARSKSSKLNDPESGLTVVHRSGRHFEVCWLETGRCNAIAVANHSVCATHDDHVGHAHYSSHTLNNSSVLRVALIFAGSFRAMDVTQTSLATVVLPDLVANGTIVSTFYYLDAPSKRCEACEQQRPRDDSQRSGGSWPSVSDEYVAEWALRSCVTALRYSTHGDSIEPNAICNPIDSMQWLKLQRAYAMATAHELTAVRRFDWIVRLRTDLVFLGAWPSLRSLSMHVHVPEGLVSRTTLLNDHIALVPRSLAHAYFDTIEASARRLALTACDCTSNLCGVW